MRPILLTIPRLPSSAFVPLLLLCAVVGAFFTVRSARAPLQEDETRDIYFPAMLAAGAAVALWVWQRQPVVLHSYGLFLVLGFVLAVWLATKEAIRRGIDPNVVVDLSLPLLGWSVFACRVLYILLNREQFHSFGQMVAVWDGGLSFHGSLVAAPLVIWYYARRAGISPLQLTDAIAPAVFAGYAIGRIGCLMNGCCYGNMCSAPWAMVFPVEGNRSQFTPPSHPTQLYSTVLATGLFFVMQRVRIAPFFNRFAGQITILFFALYACERAFIELFRNGATARTVFGLSWLTQAQLASILALVALAAFWSFLARRDSHVSTARLRG
ncbi:MAG TPA: prolipoprotein diacylglyceryl transferase [Abditibacteriaceae bacterium]|jgi:phosphatidylglycerol:prolipoprotein diacylglycerol transferase